MWPGLLRSGKSQEAGLVKLSLGVLHRDAKVTAGSKGSRVSLFAMRTL